MRVIEAPAPIPNDTSVQLFLAGGITGCRNWQADMIVMLEPTDLTLLNPRRENFDVTDPNVSREQIEWEFKAIKGADAVSFWFSHETIQPITLYELGRCAALGKQIFVGVDPGYMRKEDVYTQLKLARPKLYVVPSVEMLAGRIMGWREGLCLDEF